MLQGAGYLNATTTTLFTTIQDRQLSSRALGWDTNDYATNALRQCGNLSSATFTHTGYTGTQVCGDPKRDLATVLFSNRVYPRADDASLAAIEAARRDFNNLVLAAVVGG